MLRQLGRVAVSAVRLEACVAMTRVELFDLSERFEAMAHPALTTGDASKPGMHLYHVELQKPIKSVLIPKVKRLLPSRVRPYNVDLSEAIEAWLLETSDSLSARDRLIHSLWQ